MSMYVRIDQFELIRTHNNFTLSFLPRNFISICINCEKLIFCQEIKGKDISKINLHSVSSI